MPRKLFWFALTFLLAHYTLTERVFGASTRGSQATASNAAAIAANRLPLYFESNQGQTASGVRFLARAGGYTAFLTGQETVLLYHKGMPSQEHGRDAVVRMRLAGSRESSAIEGGERLPGIVNYLIGDDPSKWHTRIPTYSEVDRDQVYPGIDLTYRPDGKQLEFDFRVAPGVNPDPIRMIYSGASRMHLSVVGDLILDTDAGPVSILKPFAYQQIGSKRAPVAVSYGLLPGGEVEFQVGKYDHGSALVIDPTVGPSVDYSTYLGSGDGDTFTSIAVDGAGEAFITGSTYANNYPTGALPGYSPYSSTFPQTYFDDEVTAGFVTALNAMGTGIIYSTYIAGNSATSTIGVSLNGIAVDATGFAFVGGQTDDSTFPKVKAFQSSIPSSRSGYGVALGVVFELSQHGDSLIYSSFLGGGDYDTISAVAVDSSDNAYITGTNTVQGGSLTTSGFPVTTGVIWGHYTQQNLGAGFNDAFAAKITPPSSGNAILAYSTVIGSTGSNSPFTYGSAIAVDSSGDAYVTGSTNCNIGDHGGAITTNLNMTHVTRAQTEYVNNVWVLELNPAATAAPYIAYLGGSAPSSTYSPDTSVAGIKVDSTGQAYVAGTTEANNFQTTSGAYQTTRQLAGVSNSGTEQSDGFVTVISAGGASFTYSTYLNGTTVSAAAISEGSYGSPTISGIALGTSGQFAVSGLATTTDFPTSGSPAGTPLLSAFPGCPGNCAASAAFITKFTTSGLVYSAFLGAGNEGGVNGIASNGTDVYVMLGEYANGLNSCGAYDTDNSGGLKELVVRVLDAPAIATAVSVDSKTADVSSLPQTISLTSSISASSTVNGGTATYAVTNSSAAQIGSPVTSDPVVNGLPPSLSFTLPANTPIGTYTITEQYCGAEGFLNSSATGNLVVSSPAPATTTAVTSSLNPSVFGQSVTFTSTVSSANAAPTGSVQFEVDGVDLGGTVALSAASSTSKTATSQATTTLTATGSPHTVQADYLNSDGNFSDSSGTLVGGQTVTLAVQATLTVTGVPVTAPSYGTTFTVGSSGGSGTGAVAFAATGSCSVTGTTVTITSGTGTCSVTATKAADADYASATSAAVMVSATTATQATLTVTGVPVTARTYGTTFAVSSSGGSGTGSVTFAATGSCSVSGTTVTMTSGTGTCSVTATKEADANYANATSAAAMVSATTATQATLTVTGVPVTAQSYGTTFTVSSSGGSGTGSVTFAATGSCSVTGTTVTMTSGTGTCSITATKAADANYSSASSAGATVGASLATQMTLTVTGVPVTAQSYGTTFTVGSSGGSGTGAVTFAATGSCSVTGTTVTITSGTGTCSVIATKAADANYINATSAAVELQVTRSETVTTLVITPGTSVNAGTAITLTATIPGGYPGTVTFCTANAAQCSAAQLNSSGIATLKLIPGVGTYSIVAAFAGTSTEGASSSAAQTLTINGAGNYPSSTSIAATGVPGDYTLTGTVTGFGIVAPSGTVNFLNTTASTTIGSATLDPATLDSGFVQASGSPIPLQSVVQTAVGWEASGDFNGDGIPDLAVVSSDSQSHVYVLLGIGDGTFHAAAAYAIGEYTGFVTVADVNNDGHPDIIVANTFSGNVGVLLGNANGTFSAETTFPVGSGPSFVAVGDVNGDGIPDFIVANTADNTISVLLGDGTGHFATQVTYLVSAANGIAIGDFNGDGKPDLAVSNSYVYPSTLGSIDLLLGNGDGTFLAANSLAVPSGVSPSALAAADLRKDGRLDLIFADNGTAINPASPAVYLMLGNNDGTFGAVATYPTEDYAQSVSVGDINHDGILDVVVPDSANDGNGTSVSVLIGNGGGTLKAKTDYLVGGDAAPYDAVLADFNGDGLLDISTANYSTRSVTTLLQQQVETAILNNAAVTGSGAQLADASYPGDTSHAPSLSTTTSLTPTIATTNTLTSSAPAVNAGASVTFTATIVPLPMGSTRGAVSFYSNGVLLGSGSVAIDSSGVATYTTTGLAPGAHAITAVFSGNASYSASTSAAIIETITVVTTSILTVAPNPAVAGQSATSTLTISPAPTGSPLGTVSFYNGSTLLGTGTVNSSGVAIFSTTTLPLGADLITAAYSGNAASASSTSAAITVQVNSANATATVTALTSSNLAPTYGQSVALTATITPAPSVTPPGTVSFYAGTTLLGTEALNAHGVGTVSLSLPLGLNAITAVYSGSAGFAASRSGPLSISTRALSAIMLSASPTTQLATMPVVFTGLVSSATSGVQTGTVSFLNGSTVLATVTIVAGQPGVYTETGLSSGAYSVTASYSGDASFLPSASTGAPISITVSDLSLALSGGNNKSVVPGGAVSYNFTLSPVITSTFLNSVALTATGLPPGATYTFSPSTIPAGSESLPVAFTVQTAKTTAILRRAPGTSRSPWFALLFGLLLPLGGAKRFRARLTTLPRKLLLLLVGAVSLGLVAGLGGCGSGGFLGSPPGQTSYTITISATSGTLVRTSTVQLNLE
jgi:hypothetical protein